MELKDIARGVPDEIGTVFEPIGSTRRRAAAAGFRLQAPGRGQKPSGVGRIRQSIERCHNFFVQFGRIAQRWDRSARQFLGWVLNADVIFGQRRRTLQSRSGST